MSKPMYCPMSFNGTNSMLNDWKVECTPDCAWAAKDDEDYWCGMISTSSCNINTRPLKEEDYGKVE